MKIFSMGFCKMSWGKRFIRRKVQYNIQFLAKNTNTANSAKQHINPITALTL